MKRIRWLGAVGLSIAALVLLSAAAPAQPDERILDAFETVSEWTAAASDGVDATVTTAPGARGQAVRLDFDFRGGAGYAAMRRRLPTHLPENYEISFLLRAEAPQNNLELKFVDASGENVWWRVWRNHAFSGEWTRMVVRRRQIEFAWGLTQDRALRRFDSIEFVVSAGSGGRGAIAIDDLNIRELPPPPSVTPRPATSAGSAAPGHSAALAADGDMQTAWRSGGGGEQTITLDLGFEREFGGLVLRWEQGRHASRYDIEFSSDNTMWRLARRVTEGDGGVDPLMLAESQARFVRLRLLEGASEAYGLAEVEIRDLAFGASPQAFFEAIARESQRGSFPRGLSGEQTYWTLIGVDGGAAHSALLSEDGAIELGRGGVSIEPFVLTNGRRFSWADVEISQSLRDGYLPIPSVQWRASGWTLTTTAYAMGAADAPNMVARYEIHNTARQTQEMSLVLAVRPFQVNPPQQFLNTPGGFSPIRAIAWQGGRLAVNGRSAVVPMGAPDALAGANFDDGAWIGSNANGDAWQSEDGFAAGALIYRMRLRPGQRTQVVLSAPLADVAPPLELTRARSDEIEGAVAAEWRAKLNRVQLDLPDPRISNTIRASVAYMLMSRDRAALQPGTRSYARSWIRDGAMMSEGLLRMGLDEPVRAYLDWYAPFQFDNGKTPCCVDARGADPVSENDSHGELIHLAALVHRYTGDAATLERAWPQVEAAAAYIERLRQSERTEANRSAERRALFGLLPPSISHEGYSSRPAYSYWDDFWALRGYEDAAYLAEVRGDAVAASRLRAQRDEFHADLNASIVAAMDQHRIDYIPGAADLGDFDATSTTIALSPGGQADALPRRALEATFDRYWRNFVARRDGGQAYAYTPYELRVVGAFVRLGWRERANEALEFFFDDRRPRAWNHWAEVVERQPRQMRFVGDMPHGWVASDYVRSALDMLVYERPSDEALVIGAGAPAAWFAGRGMAVEELRTPYGRLSFAMRREGDGYRLRMWGDARPPGGFFIAPPSIDGRRLCVRGASVAQGTLHLSRLRAAAMIRPCDGGGEE